ncbi:glycoside hydrolase family 65 protein [Nocardioides montaniterrae]
MESNDSWLLEEQGWDPARANYHETVFTVGNGRLGTRGCLEERHTGAIPGTFVAGVYDGHDSPVVDLVTAPDWLSTDVYVDGVRLDTQSATVASHHRVLDLRTGVLTRTTELTDAAGRRTRLVTRRLASMADRDLCALQIEVTPLDHDAEIVVLTGIDGHCRNLERLPAYPEGTRFGYDRKWDKWARSTHLVEQGHGFEAGIGHLTMRTIESGVDIGYAVEVSTPGDAVPRRQVQRHEYVGVQLTFEGRAGEPVVVDKLVAIATSRDPIGVPDVRARAMEVLGRHGAGGYQAAAEASAVAWERLWDASDITVVGDDRVTLALRLSVYHLLIAANPDDPTVSIGAKSLSGEGYRGHVFWDTEIMMLPFFLFTQPQTARALLGYRHHTLPGARQVSQENGTGGARFPWESAGTGLEECPMFTPDGQNRFYTREEEVHVSADVAFGIVQYAAVTGDDDFLLGDGAEVLFETSRFWVDRCEADGDRLAIRKVMGPDEFHSHVDNNAFTNRLAAWHLEQAVAVHDRMRTERPEQLAELADRIGLGPDEPARWADAAARITAVPAADAGLIEQFDGYFDRLDVPVTDWDANDMPRYPEGRNHFNCEETQLLKQPDVVMLMYLFPDAYTPETRRANFDYYEARTLHKSSLSPSIHAIVGLEIGDTEHAERYFGRSAYVDLDDNQGNTEEGIHIASAGGTWQIAVHGFGGFRVLQGGLHFDPKLPASWERLRFSVRHGDAVVRADLGHDDAVLLMEGVAELPVVVRGAEVTLRNGVEQRVPLTASCPPSGR